MYLGGTLTCEISQQTPDRGIPKTIRFAQLLDALLKQVIQAKSVFREWGPHIINTGGKYKSTQKFRRLHAPFSRDYVYQMQT
jgi:hypothetical protein